jgi:predicted secreted protein
MPQTDLLLTPGDNGGSITAQVGDILTVQLPETPATGFRWSLPPGDLGSLALAGDDFELGPRSAVGGGGLRRLRFAVRRPGAAHLEIRLARSWESGASKAVFRIRVEVG